MVFLGIGSYLLIWILWNSVGENRDERMIRISLRWLKAEGTVTISKTVWTHVEVTYEFTVSGRSYTGRYDMTLPPATPDPGSRGALVFASEAKSLMKDYSPGTKVMVRYNPLQPSESVLFCRARRLPLRTRPSI